MEDDGVAAANAAAAAFLAIGDDNFDAEAADDAEVGFAEGMLLLDAEGLDGMEGTAIGEGDGDLEDGLAVNDCSEVCLTCEGTGKADGSKLCEFCNGSGKIDLEVEDEEEDRLLDSPGDQGDHCLAGHPLVATAAVLAGSCDRCRATFGSGVQVSSCSICNYDICAACAMQGKLVGALMSPSMSPSNGFPPPSPFVASIDMAALSSNQVDGERKALPCKFWQLGRCHKGSACDKRHDGTAGREDKLVIPGGPATAKLDPKTGRRFCRFWASPGGCRNGATCHWPHGRDEDLPEDIRRMRAVCEFAAPTECQSCGGIGCADCKDDDDDIAQGDLVAPEAEIVVLAEQRLDFATVPEDNLVEVRSLGTECLDREDLISWVEGQCDVPVGSCDIKIASSGLMAMLAFADSEAADKIVEMPPPAADVFRKEEFSQEAEDLIRGVTRSNSDAHPGLELGNDAFDLSDCVLPDNLILDFDAMLADEVVHYPFMEERHDPLFDEDMTDYAVVEAERLLALAASTTGVSLNALIEENVGLTKEMTRSIALVEQEMATKKKSLEEAAASEAGLHAVGLAALAKPANPLQTGVGDPASGARAEDEDTSDEEEEGTLDQDGYHIFPFLAQYIAEHPQRLVVATRSKRRRTCGPSGELTEQTSCWACGSQNHQAGRCRSKRCFFCSAKGHDGKNCPQKTLNSNACQHCRLRGHLSEHCATLASKEPVSLAKIRCLRCRYLGHSNCGREPESAVVAPSAGLNCKAPQPQRPLANVGHTGKSGPATITKNSNSIRGPTIGLVSEVPNSNIAHVPAPKKGHSSSHPVASVNGVAPMAMPASSASQTQVAKMSVAKTTTAKSPVAKTPVAKTPVAKMPTATAAEAPVAKMQAAKLAPPHQQPGAVVPKTPRKAASEACEQGEGKPVGALIPKARLETAIAASAGEAAKTPETAGLAVNAPIATVPAKASSGKSGAGGPKSSIPKTLTPKMSDKPIAKIPAKAPIAKIGELAKIGNEALTPIAKTQAQAPVAKTPAKASAASSDTTIDAAGSNKLSAQAAPAKTAGAFVNSLIAKTSSIAAIVKNGGREVDVPSAKTPAKAVVPSAEGNTAQTDEGDVFDRKRPANALHAKRPAQAMSNEEAEAQAAPGNEDAERLPPRQKAPRLESSISEITGLEDTATSPLQVAEPPSAKTSAHNSLTAPTAETSNPAAPVAKIASKAAPTARKPSEVPVVPVAKTVAAASPAPSQHVPTLAVAKISTKAAPAIAKPAQVPALGGSVMPTPVPVAEAKPLTALAPELAAAPVVRSDQVPAAQVAKIATKAAPAARKPVGTQIAKVVSKVAAPAANIASPVQIADPSKKDPSFQTLGEANATPFAKTSADLAASLSMQLSRADMVVETFAEADATEDAKSCVEPARLSTDSSMVDFVAEALREAEVPVKMDVASLDANVSALRKRAVPSSSIADLIAETLAEAEEVTGLIEISRTEAPRTNVNEQPEMHTPKVLAKVRPPKALSKSQVSCPVPPKVAAKSQVAPQNGGLDASPQGSAIAALVADTLAEVEATPGSSGEPRHKVPRLDSCNQAILEVSPDAQAPKALSKAQAPKALSKLQAAHSVPGKAAAKYLAAPQNNNAQESLHDSSIADLISETLVEAAAMAESSGEPRPKISMQDPAEAQFAPPAATGQVNAKAKAQAKTQSKASAVSAPVTIQAPAHSLAASKASSPASCPQANANEIQGRCDQEQLQLRVGLLSGAAPEMLEDLKNDLVQLGEASAVEIIMEAALDRFLLRGEPGSRREASDNLPQLIEFYFGKETG